MKISVIIPVYNEEDLIKKSLSSVAEQDYPKKNFEILVVNDGSTDGTKQRVEKLIKKHKGVRIRLINQKNSGRALTRENGAKKAKYETLLFLDSRCELGAGVLKALKKINYKPMIGNNIFKDEGAIPRFGYLIRRRIYGDAIMRGEFERFYIDEKEFRKNPVGTGILFVDRKMFLGTMDKGLRDRNSSDDTKIIGSLAKSKMVLRDKAFKVFYNPRKSLKHHIKHTYDRGPKFVDYYFKPGRKYFPHLVVMLLGLITLLDLLIFYPIWFGYAVLALIALDVVLSVYFSQRFTDFFLMLVLFPITTVTFIGGILRGLVRRLGI